MRFFAPIQNGAVLLRSKSGVFREAPVYQRGGEVFAKYGGGFVRLSQNEGTSLKNVFWTELDVGAGAYEVGMRVTYTPPMAASVAVAAE